MKSISMKDVACTLNMNEYRYIEHEVRPMFQDGKIVEGKKDGYNVICFGTSEDGSRKALQVKCENVFDETDGSEIAPLIEFSEELKVIPYIDTSTHRINFSISAGAAKIKSNGNVKPVKSVEPAVK